MLNDYSRGKFPKKYQNFISKSLPLLKKARDLVMKDQLDEYYKTMSSLLKEIGETDKRIGQYIEEVIRYAMVRKGSRIYAHGISMGRVAELLGISEWELMERTGWMPGKEFIEKVIVTPKTRFSYVRELFKWETDFGKEYYNGEV